MYKYKKPLEKHEIEKLKELSQLDFSTMNETDVREEYITHLLSLLGYKKNSDYEVEREETSDLVDMSLNIGSKKLKLDYKFNIRKKYFWLIEAKTGKDKNISKENIEQAYLYSLHPDINCRFFAVCNGWYFNLYDRNAWLFKNLDTDIFVPILQIEHTNLNEETFNQLYSFLGSSEIIFKVKEDILLTDIQNTLEAEIYMERLHEFKRKIDNILYKAERSVRENIQKLTNITRDTEIRKKNFEELLRSQSSSAIVDIVLNKPMTSWEIEITYKIIKEKILPYKNISSIHNNSHCKSDIFFDYLFLYPLRPIQIEYIWNVVCLLKFLCSDIDLKGMFCRYNGEKIEISELLNRYVYDIFSFFENRKDIRAIIILYPLWYRIIKYFSYYGLQSEIKNKYLTVKKYMEKHLTEEMLSRQYYSPGHEIIEFSHQMMMIMEQYFINIAFGKKSSFSLRNIDSYGKTINDEVIKQEIYNLENILKAISEESNLDKLREQMPSEFEDEMFSFDRYYENPWSIIFLYTLRCCKGYSLASRNIDKIKKEIENGFLSIIEYVKFISNEDIYNKIKNREISEQDLLNDYKININDKTVEIITTLKNNWD